MKKSKNDHHFVNINLWKDFKLLTPQSMGLHFSECQQKQNIRVSHYEKIKNGHHFININCMENYWPHPKGLGLQFSECQWKQNISVSHYEKIKKWLPFFKYQSYGKISNYWSLPKVWVSRFWVSMKTGYQSQQLWKNQKWPPFHKYQSYRKFSKYQPCPQGLGLQFSKCWWKWNISIYHYQKCEKWPPFCKYLLYRKISNYWPPKFCVSSFLSINENGISVLVIMIKIEKSSPFHKYWSYRRSWTPGSLGLQFTPQITHM